MKTEFNPKTEALAKDQREFFESAANLEEAREIAPWACEIVEVEGGWKAFESYDDLNVWENQ